MGIWVEACDSKLFFRWNSEPLTRDSSDGLARLESAPDERIEMRMRRKRNARKNGFLFEIIFVFTLSIQVKNLSYFYCSIFFVLLRASSSPLPFRCYVIIASLFVHRRILIRQTIDNNNWDLSLRQRPGKWVKSCEFLFFAASI